MNGYFDNASTSFPKPKEVGEWIEKYLASGGTYGRAGHRKSIEVARVVEETRDLLSSLMGIAEPENLVFCSSATEGSNAVLSGFAFKNKRVLVDSMSHNAVTRPLHHLKESIGLECSIVPHFSDGLIDIDQLKSMVDSTVDMVIVNHVSNVNGVIQNIREIKNAIGDIPLLLDASQSAGKVPVKANEWGVDYLFFTAHKGLLGPTGVGAFYANNPSNLPPYKYGGTGSNSESELMPPYNPDKFEAGTPNSLGIFGLYGALTANLKSLHSQEDFYLLLEKIEQLKAYEVYCAQNRENQSELFSLRHRGKSNDELAYVLDRKYDIQVRSGLHCAPFAHKALGTFPNGSVRFSISPFHTTLDFENLYNVLEGIS
ncbi:aminotransferase class V-fold PLP-dependent enzyme [uncultured Acetobacteroides sp.]|uniref:aminotransferase class V-fold PLP-dependent enzyme n=1 Tax=uncultured Acetobacteroides sp. TaxID=1760811 RepID=UPI0029F5814E|nr:aminotransferase class V-fold PLP-dependent enzyme [uncultured Acetobacteroides sp.]